MASPYRADHVGSLLRPPELLEVKAQFAEGKVTEDQLHAAEDAAVLKALELQKSAGIDVVTDGEYRRVAWSAAATNALGGLVPVQGSPIRRIFADWRGPDAEELNQTMARGQAMVAGQKLTKTRRFVDVDAAFLKQHAGAPWKITLPGPVSMAGGMFEPGVSDKAYSSMLDVAGDLAGMVNDEMKALLADGCNYIQMDSLHYVERIADVTVRPRMDAAGEDPDAYLDELIRLDNVALAGIRGTGDVTVGLHMCRGNARSALARRRQLRADRRKGLRPAQRRPLPARVRQRPRRRLRAPALRPARQDGRARPDQHQGAGAGAGRNAAPPHRRGLEVRPVDQLAVSPQCGFAAPSSATCSPGTSSAASWSWWRR